MQIRFLSETFETISFMFTPFAELLSLSKEGRRCEEDCPKACHHVEYQTALSYAKLQRDVFVEHFLSFLNTTLESSASLSLYNEYQPFFNMTKPERREYIE